MKDLILGLIFMLLTASATFPQTADTDVRQYPNPLEYASVPFQYNFDFNIPMMVSMITHVWGIGLTSEIGFGWMKRITTGAIILTGQKTLKIGRQVINFVLGPKLFFGNFNAPGFGFRASVNLLFL